MLKRGVPLLYMAQAQGKQAQVVIVTELRAMLRAGGPLRGLPEHAGVFTAPNEAFLKMRPARC